MKKTFALIVCYFVFLFILHAQDSSMAVSRNKYVQADIGIGYLNTNMQSINTTLKSMGYQPIKDNYATFSFSTAYFVNRFLFRAEVSMLLPSQIDQPNDMKTTFTGYTVSAGIGYALIQRPSFRLYPYVGVNAFNTALHFTDHSPVSDINDVLNRRNATLTFSNASLDMGVQLERLIPVKNNQWDCPQNSRYMTIGTRIGYNWSPGTIKTRSNGNVVNGAPEYKFQGPYIKIVVGMGTKIRTLKWK